ncbi:MAG: AMP-binding protein [Candidatus Omnitrophota bacterium]
MDIVRLLEKQAKDHTNKPAIIFRGEVITFAQLKDNAFGFADALKRMGVSKNSKVAIYLPNSPQYAYSYLAIWAIGATAVPLDFMLTEEELVECLKHSEAKALIIGLKANISLDNIRQKLPALTVITCGQEVPGCQRLENLLEKAPKVAPTAAYQELDYAIIFYTSGTTGKPKGVLINYKQLSAPPQSMDFFVGGIKSDDVALSALPFSHLGGLIYLENCISFGLTIVLMERFVPLEFLKNIQNYKVTCFWIVPSMYYAILQLKEFESFDLSTLRWIVTFGASSSADALRRFHQYCPNAHLLNGWGLTETNAPTVVLPRESQKIESVGRPAPWIEVKIWDGNAKVAPQGEVGEVVVKGWVVTDGYYKDPELTAQALRNGWFHTGDLGRFDEDGQLYIVGRIKEMIKVGGEIVFEPEVESVLLKHPDIAEAAVIGVTDKLRGEVPKAFIVAKENKDIDEDALRYFLRQHLAHFKIPHYFEFVPGLPKNRSGKIDKETLRK